MVNLKHFFVLVGAVAATAAFTAFYNGAGYDRPDEKWLEDKMLTELHGYEVDPRINEKITYRMDETSYEVLNPIGIACQRMKNEYGQEFDVVVIASDSMQAFHDQQICFNAQGWEIMEGKSQIIPLETQAHGEIPVQLMTIKRRNANEEQTAVYFFRSPKGFVTYGRAKVDYMLNQLATGKPALGFSYRFIGLSPNLTQKDVLRFAQQYVDELDKTSNGVL